MPVGAQGPALGEREEAGESAAERCARLREQRGD